MPQKRDYSEITPEILKMTDICVNNSRIPQELYAKYQVNRGLRDINGNGVLTGLTEISEIVSKKNIDGVMTPCDGELYYRGYNVHDLIRGLVDDNRFGYEEIAYLLLLGQLPTRDELSEFNRVLASYRSLPASFTRDIIMKAPSTNIMNSLARSVLTLYSYDNNAEDLSLPNVLRQNLQLLATMPMLSIYAYHAYKYFHTGGGSLTIRDPDPSLSTAENILMMLRSNGKYTATEAHVLDVALILHAEHGGGNNSSFTTHVVTSSGTDTYSAISAALCSLKGPKHGGANIKVSKMFDDIKAGVKDWGDDDEIREYLRKILNKEAFDRTGLIYGMGHAVYSISDPRSVILEKYLDKLATEKGRERELMLYEKVEKIAPQVISEKKTIYKGVSANVDFYSGLVYQLLNIPEEIYTPLFAIARTAGWGAHRMEELTNGNRIIRPAYRAVGERREYLNIKDR